MLLVRHDPASAALVRRTIAGDLASAQLTPDSVDDVLLVISELVGNAVVHTDGPSHGTDDGGHLDVGWDVCEDEVFVRVNDGSSEQPMVVHAPLDAGSGRGLTIVAAIAAEWGVRPVSRGKQVWARIPVRRAV